MSECDFHKLEERAQEKTELPISGLQIIWTSKVIKDLTIIILTHQPSKWAIMYTSKVCYSF